MPITILGKGQAPEDAIEYWKAKTKITSLEAKILTEEARERAFYVAGLAKLDQVNMVHNALLEALKEGHSIETFKKNIAGLIKQKGWDKRRIETIFNTNMQTAYQAGRWKSIERNKKSFPYLQYSSVLDKRTRPAHSVLHGKVYPVDHQFWNSYYPPNGFNCRCTALQLSQYYVDKEGLSIEKTLPKHLPYTDPQTGNTFTVTNAKPDYGFTNNVGKDWLKNLETPLYEKLEKSDEGISQSFIENLMIKDFEKWRQKPIISMPVAVLSKKQVQLLQSKSKIIRLSSDTMIKQDNHHPELTLNDYLKIQKAISANNIHKQNENSYAFLLEEHDGIVCIVKVTQEQDKLYLTSMRRLSNDEIKKDETIRRIKRGQQK